MPVDLKKLEGEEEEGPPYEPPKEIPVKECPAMMPSCSEHCPWWNVQANECYVKTIARALMGLLGKM